MVGGTATPRRDREVKACGLCGALRAIEDTYFFDSGAGEIRICMFCIVASVRNAVFGRIEELRRLEEGLDEWKQWYLRQVEARR